MDDAELQSLRQELARLEAEEALVSAQRRHLHQKIDFGYATDEARAREREVSDQRRELHHRIDELRELLGLERPVAATAEVSDGGGEGLESQYLDLS
jgi:hypothetical protein